MAIGGLDHSPAVTLTARANVTMSETKACGIFEGVASELHRRMNMVTYALIVKGTRECPLGVPLSRPVIGSNDRPPGLGGVHSNHTAQEAMT